MSLLMLTSGQPAKNSLEPFVAASPPVQNLNLYGGACRCLLRLLENDGQPPWLDADFLRHYRPLHPEWRLRPGVTDALAIFELTHQLGLATGIAISRDYSQVLRAHRAGQPVLILTEKTPVQQERTAGPQPHALLLQDMDEAGFVVWCPFESGASDLLPRASRNWWENWLSVGLILSRRPAD